MEKIDLEKYLKADSELRRQELDPTVFLCQLKDKDMESLALLADKLKKVGIRVMAHRHEQEDTVSFTIDYETYDKAIKRSAGRKLDVTKEQRYTPCTVSELNMMLSCGMRKTEIIAKLGCPKSTFYRILQNIGNAREHDSIWLYTYPSIKE